MSATRNRLLAKRITGLMARPLRSFTPVPPGTNGRMYVASTDYSRLDDNYVAKRGFHWYAYDIPDSTFLDLSISEPKGVGAEHAQVMAIAVDSQRGYLYGIGTPRSHIYQHEIATGRTKDLGRHPALQRKYYEPGRYIWVDSKGRVYFTVESVPHVLYYDSETEWGAHRDWRLKAGEIKVGQWSLDGKRCYVSDYEAHFYRFDDDQRTWTYLGQGDFDRKYGPSRRNDNTFITRSLNLSADEKKIYFPNDRAVETFALFEWDVSTPASTPLCELSALDERIAGTQYQYHSGHNSWDNEGRFYFVSFGSRSAMHDAILTRVDPVRLKVALGLLSSLTEVTIRFTAEKDVVVTRTGETSELLEVILAVEASQVNGLLPNNRYAHVVIPAGSSTVTVSRSEIIPEQVGRTGEVSWTVIPNGNTYIAYDAEIRD